MKWAYSMVSIALKWCVDRSCILSNVHVHSTLYTTIASLILLNTPIPNHAIPCRSLQHTLAKQMCLRVRERRAHILSKCNLYIDFHSINTNSPTNWLSAAVLQCTLAMSFGKFCEHKNGNKIINGFMHNMRNCCHHTFSVWESTQYKRNTFNGSPFVW